jgi:hypothetical protein
MAATDCQSAVRRFLSSTHRRNPTRWIWTKLHDLVLALACLALVWLAFTWNLMNSNIHY